MVDEKSERLVTGVEFDGSLDVGLHRVGPTVVTIPTSAAALVTTIRTMAVLHPQRPANANPSGTPNTVPIARPDRTRDRALPRSSGPARLAATADDKGE